MYLPPWSSDELSLPAQLEDALTEAPANGAFSLITTLATRLFAAPAAAISLVNQRGRWIHCTAGLGEEWVSREIPLCSAALGSEEPLVVGDAREDARFPRELIAGGPSGLTFYAGVPLIGLNGARLGVISVMDRAPRPWSARETSLLEHLACLALEALGQRGGSAGPEELTLFRSKSNLYRHLFENATDIVYAHDLSGRFIAINRAVEFLTGYSRREVLDMNITDLVHPDDRPRVERHIYELAGGRDPGVIELAFQRRAGAVLTLEISTRLLFEHGRPVGVQGFARDVTQRKLELAARQQVERRLVDKTRELANFTEHLRQLHRLSTTSYQSQDELFDDCLRAGCAIFRLPDGMIAQLDGDSFVVRASASGSPRCRPGTRFDGKRVPWAAPLDEQRTVTFVSARADGAAHDSPACCIATSIIVGEKVYGTLCFCSDDSRRVPEFSAQDLEIIELIAKIIGRFVLELEVQGERQRAAAEQRTLTSLLAYQAQHDALTGLPNRSHMIESLARVVEKAREQGDMLAVLFIDLDRLKQINDTLGHAVGDLLLQHVARRLEAELQPGETAGRMGGDEFAVVFPRVADADLAVGRARQLLEVLRAPYSLDGREVFVTASIGATLFPRDGADAHTLLTNADLAMYRAKNLGKNEVQSFGPDVGPPAVHHFELETQLRRALDNHELDLHFQPQVRLDGRLDGFEVLLVWRNPLHGRLPAGRFISIAEESGMIVEIGSWVLEQACLQNARWQRAGYRPMRIAVNVSPLQFARSDFIDAVAGALRSSGLEARYLDLELTESSVMRNLEQSTRCMAKLRELGIGLSIDDFGTGYSSLSYLRRLPVDALKIDRSFLNEGKLTGGSLSMIQTIVLLAHNMGLSVVGEGVESLRHLEMLRAAGCDRVQGHLFGETLPVGEAEALLARVDGLVPMVKRPD